jgi:DNA-binding MarR family transcriptional regulator
MTTPPGGHAGAAGAEGHAGVTGPEGHAGAAGFELVDGLVQLSFVVQAVLGRIADQHELSTTQVRMLAVLEDREIGMLQLARILELEKSSVTGLVDRAERRDLVRRVAVPGNRRAVHVVLTEHGQELVRAVRSAARAQIAASLTGSLDEAAQNRLSRLAAALIQRYASQHAIPR